MTAREDRIARNEALFREVNERIKGVREEAGELAAGSSFAILCECGDESCVEEIQLTSQEYERVRSDAAQFAIAPGHAIPDVETVIAQGDGFEVARKQPEEAEIARRTDPRS
jgi:hypothetical protein